MYIISLQELKKMGCVWSIFGCSKWKLNSDPTWFFSRASLKSNFTTSRSNPTKLCRGTPDDVPLMLKSMDRPDKSDRL